MLEKYENEIKTTIKQPYDLGDVSYSTFKVNYTLANEKTLNFGSIFHQIISKVLTDFTDGFNFALELKELSKLP